MRRVPVLSIEWSAGAVRYRLDVPERDQGEPLLEEFRHPLDEDTLRALEQSADALLRSAESPAFPQEAQARGAVLYRTLVPSRLRAPLKAVQGPLLVSTSLVGMPWELLYDGEEFWGLRYALGKRLVLDRPLPTVVGLPLRARPRALIIGSDPRHDLAFVGHEVEAICETLEQFADIDCVTDQLATFDIVTTYLSRGYDIIHYCGHVVHGDDGRPALLLADERPLSLAAIEANVSGRPLVFLNGCASARGSDGEALDDGWEATASSVAYSFLFGGASGVVATLSDVSDRHAATVADEFYRQALGGAPVGEALRAARVHCRNAAESAASPSWLSFVLYGNPAHVLLSSPGGAELVPAAAPEAPTAPSPTTARRPRNWRAAFVATLVVLAGALGVAFFKLSPTHAPAPVVVGVMEVQARTPAVPPWMREITRDGLNTILSKFPPIRVYSRQKIDFLRQKRGLSEIEAAEALGMSKMVSATVGVADGQVTLDLEVVDIATGLLEGFERVQGPEDRFMELQAEFAVRTLGVLGVTPTTDEVKTILADRNNETLRAYRLLTETLGEPAEKKREMPEPPAPVPSNPGTSWLHWSSVAYADEPSRDEADIRALLERYATALQAKNVDALAALQVDMSDKQRRSLERYFSTAGDLQVRLHDIDILIEGDEAIATFTREDVFVDAGTGRRTRLEVRISGMLVRDHGVWKIVGLRDPL